MSSTILQSPLVSEHKGQGLKQVVGINLAIAQVLLWWYTRRFALTGDYRIIRTSFTPDP